MALRIRMKQLGRKNRPFYRMVVTDGRNPRDGRVTETIGWYNPSDDHEDRHLQVKADRVQHWLDHGAELSEKAMHLVAKAAPHVVKQLKAKQLEKRAKASAKRKERRRAKAAA